MIESPDPRHRRPHTEPDRHSPEIAPAPASADLLESAMWPYLPICAARAISMTLLLVMAVGVFATFSRGAHAQSTEVLISNGEPPPSARLLLVNLTQRHVAQEFTTGPHPAGYDVYAVAVRTESSNGKHDMGLQGRIRSRRWEPVGPWNIMLPHRQVGPTLMRSRPIADFNWSWFTASEPIHLEPNETYFFELVCRWGCFVIDNGVALGLTESDDEDASTLPGWSMADGFMIQNARFNRWWGDMVVGTDGFFHPNPEGPALRLAIRGEPREISGPGPGQSDDANTGPQPREWTARVGPVAAGRFVETAGAGVSVAVDGGRIATRGFEANGRVTEAGVGAATGTAGAAFRPSRRTGAMAVSYAPANHVYAVPAGDLGRERAETTPARMSPCLGLALSEPVSRWDTRRCDDG